MRADTDTMSAAEFKIVREHLGLTTRWIAERLGVQERTVQRWDNGERGYTIPERVREQMEAWEQDTALTVTGEIERLHDHPDPAAVVIRTYRTDADYRAVEPDAGWPASWHRAVCARIADEIPGLRFAFWQAADE